MYNTPQYPIIRTQKKAEEAMYMWELLYNSHRDGTSMNRFKHHVFGYTGPTVLAIRDREGVCVKNMSIDPTFLYPPFLDSPFLDPLPSFFSTN